MIFVTVGISNLPFERLLAAVDDLPVEGEEVVVQRGAATTRPRRAALCFDYLAFADFERYISEARVVVCHGGIGSVGLCLTSGRHPIVVPRLRQHGEAVDDHQRWFARRLDDLGLASVVEDMAQLGDLLRTAPTRQPRTGLSPELAGELVAYLGQFATIADADDSAGAVHRASSAR